MSSSFSPEQFYDNARYLIALEMGLPYLEKIEPEKGESTLFALLVYIASKDNSLDNETISSFYRVFLQDILTRTKDGVTASRYQTFLNEAITKFNAVPLASDGTTDVKALAETADELISLTENETADVMAFVNNNRATLYTLGDVFVPTVEPVTPIIPTQHPFTHAQQSGAPAQGVSGVATYTPADFAQQPTQTENVPLSHARQSGMASQGVSGVATYTPADFAQPVTPQPMYTPPVASTYNPQIPQQQVQYTNPQYHGNIPPTQNPLNGIGGWLLIFIIFTSYALATDLGMVIYYVDLGSSFLALLSALRTIFSALIIFFIDTRNKKAYLVFVIQRIYVILFYIVFDPSPELLINSIIATCIWGAYLYNSERVQTVLGPFHPNAKSNITPNLEEQLKQNRKQ